MPERLNFHPHEIYENFQKQVPHQKIGFRGQPNEFMEITAQNGFDRRRNFVVLKLFRSWESMRRNRTKLNELLDVPLACGRTENEENKNLETVEGYLNYYMQQPEKYASLLLLDFKGLRGWLYTNFLFSLGCTDWNVRKLPTQVITGVITLDSQDFSDVYVQLSQKPNQLDASLHAYKNYLKMQKLLKRKFIRKAMQTIIELKQSPA